MEQTPPRGGPEDHSDTSEQSSSTNDRSSNGTNAPPPTSANQSRRRGSRGGQGRAKPAAEGASSASKNPEELPEPMREGRLGSPEAREEALVKKPQIGDTMPVPNVPPPGPANDPSEEAQGSPSSNRSGQKRRRKSGGQKGQQQKKQDTESANGKGASSGSSSKGRSSSRRRRRGGELSAEARDQRRGRERNGKPIGRYFMCVQVREGITQVAVLEGRNLIEHYVSRPADDVSQIHGNIYLGRVQNVLPGMEAAFVDIATPKNAVLYRGDVQYDSEDIESDGNDPRIEQILKNRQTILCQVTKNPIGAKGARLTQEVSLPGRFVVLIPNSTTYGISKRLPDQVRRRLRSILDKVKPEGHGLIVRTAAEHATEAELTADMRMLLEQWDRIEAQAKGLKKPALLHREPELAVRVIREEFNADYRGVVIDDRRLYEEVREYVAAFNPELADRVEYYDAEAEGLALFERHHVHEQVHKALDRKVWLPSGGSLIIEHTEALSVIDVNTGKNVGTSNLEETVFSNNLEAAEEIAKQLRLRDIGGIIVIDFIDMEVKANRAKVIETFRDALARDKTRTQVFDISELGLVEMTRKRIGEGLLTEFSDQCPNCTGRGVVVDHSLLD
ncbi:MAG: Rne/Rng family ribonuclease [Ilumatobacteraceae bacterium]|nr:Rne/Rng family ribonuclease [Ilumatobacteraceae bacterium]